MAAKAKPNTDRPELAPVTYNLATVPMLNRAATDLRNKISAYVEYMTKGGKTPRQIHVFADQLATLRRAVNAQLSDAAPPCGDLTWNGLPLVVEHKGRPHAP